MAREQSKTELQQEHYQKDKVETGDHPTVSQLLNRTVKRRDPQNKQAAEKALEIFTKEISILVTIIIEMQLI